jgi:hypothetical protein
MGQAGDEHPVLPVVEGVQRAGDRELAAAGGVALDRVVAQPLERRR